MKVSKIKGTLLIAVLLLTTLAIAIPFTSAGIVEFNVIITDNKSQFTDPPETLFGARSNEGFGIPITSGLTLDELFAEDGLQYTYTVIDGGSANGAAPIIAVIDLEDGRHITIYPGWGDRTGSQTLQFSATVSTCTSDVGDKVVDFVLEYADFRGEKLYKSVSCGYGDFEAVKADTIELDGTEVVTRVAIQHQAAGTMQKDELNSLTFSGLEVTDPITCSVTDGTVPVSDMGTVDVEGTGTITTYECDETVTGFSSGTGDYFDVKVDDPEDITSIRIEVAYTTPLPHGLLEKDLILYWYDGTDWSPCSNTGVDTGTNLIWAIITDDTIPSLSDLTGTEFGVGGSLDFDSDFYKTGETVSITLGSTDENTDSETKEMVGVWVKSDTDGLGATIALFETDLDTGIFTGTFDLVGDTPGTGEILVMSGDLIYVTYTHPTLGDIVDTAEIDDKAPVVEITAPTTTPPAILYKAGVVTITATTDETGSPFDLVFQANGVPIEKIIGALDSETYLWNTPYDVAGVPQYPDGIYTITVTATDAAGNFDSASVTLTVDNTGPTVTDTKVSPSIMGLSVPSDLVLTATIVDAGIGIDTVTVDCSDIGGASDVSMSAPVDSDVYTATLTGVIAAVEDEFNLTITATDLLANVNNLDFIAIEVINDIVGPYEVGFTEAVPISGGLIVRGLYMEDLLTGPGEYGILVDDVLFATITETQLISEIWMSTPDEYGVFKRSIVLDLTGMADPVNVTVIAYDLVGTPADEIILYEGLIPDGEWAAVELYAGWNLVSLPLIPDSSDSGDILSLILDQGASGVVFSYGYDQYTDAWITNPAEMPDGYGYWLYVLADDVMIVEGIKTLPAPSLPATYEFTEGWVLAGYKQIAANDIDIYLGSLETGSYYGTVYAWDAATPAWYTVQTGEGIDELLPGIGFWIWMHSDQSLITPLEGP